VKGIAPGPIEVRAPKRCKVLRTATPILKPRSELWTALVLATAL